METGYSKWRKLDNAALAFPLVTGKNDSRVFRFYCQLKEEVDPDILQKALDQTMEKYPLFQAVLRKGLFWFYLERRDIQAVVKPEKKPPCSQLYIPDQKSLLFRVSYHRNRINFEVYHALTDGTGAMNFVTELVQDYLILAHPEDKLPRIELADEATPGEQEEDSFSQYYSSKIPKNKEKKPPAVQLKGEKLIHSDMQITEVIFSVKEILAKARSYGVSITIFLTALLLRAIHEDIPKNQQKHPITLMIPVNLRNYFPSQSMGNFFGWIEVGYKFEENTTFEQLLQSVKDQFKEKLQKDRIAMDMNGYVRLEKNPFIRAVPLEIKRYFLIAGANLGGRSITAVYSNIGILKFPPEYKAYIDRFGIFASTNSLQVCSCSYEDQFVVDFTSKIPDDRIQKNFVRMLKEEGISCKEEKNEFPGCGETQKKEDRKVMQTFTFLCLAVAVICGMFNYLMLGTLNWFWFAAAGCFCAWLVVHVAYLKRRNILKNEMWQLLIITVLCVLWDHFTGWHGWSIDFVFPFGALAVLGSISVIAKINHLEREEYLYYLIQSAVVGCIPAIFTAIGLITYTWPSVLSTGISFLTLAGLFIFQKKDTLREFRKKLRI